MLPRLVFVVVFFFFNLHTACFSLFTRKVEVVFELKNRNTVRYAAFVWDPREKAALLPGQCFAVPWVP